MLTIGSLFSGIGGLDLGLEAAGLGPTLWQVEQNLFCRCVLRRHWPDAELHDDVCAVGRTNLAPVDLVCGGFPCQDVSSAGKGAGLAGERSGLWREFARVVGEIRPGWVVVENVASGAGRWLDAVMRELEKLGYACLPVPVAARDVGAPHRRERLFVVAHRDGERELQPEGRELGVGRWAADCACPDAADSDGGVLRNRKQRQPRGQSSGVLHEASAIASDNGAPWVAPNARISGREVPGTGEQVERRKGLAADPWRSPESGLVPLVHGLSGGLAGRRRRARIRALGDTVVPQCAETVGWVIRELIGEARRVA